MLLPALHGLTTVGGDVNRECVCVPWNLLAGLAVAAGFGLVGDLIDDVLMRARMHASMHSALFQRVKVKPTD